MITGFASWRCLLVVACGIAGSAAAEDGPRFRETAGEVIEVECNPCSSSPAELTASGDHLYFSADDGINGRELWSLDGEGQFRMVWNDGHESSNPKTLTSFKDGVVYLSQRSTPGLSPHYSVYYVRNGSSHTLPIADSPLSQERTTFIAGREWLYFDLNQPGTGRELWRSDGTRDGTGLAADLLPGETDGLPYGLWGRFLPNGVLGFYSMMDTSAASWVLTFLAPDDGVPYALKLDEALVPVQHFPAYSAEYGSSAVFPGFQEFHRGLLLLTDGTRDGSLFLLEDPGPEARVHEFVVAGDSLFINVITKRYGSELWHSKGTAESTRLLKDIRPGEGGSTTQKFTEVAGRVFFSANDGEHGQELWTSDGTESGTRLVKDIMPGVLNGSPYQLTSFKGLCFFSVEHQDFGEELWRSDGTPEGTWMVKDINPGRGEAEPYYLRVFGDRLYFAANDGVHGEELWSTDGTEAGTRMEADIMRPHRREPSSNPEQLTAFDGRVYFVADDGAHGRELWQATPNVAELAFDLNPGPASSDIMHLTAWEGLLHFDATGAGGVRGYYQWDGTAAPPSRVGEPLGRRAGPTLESLLPPPVLQQHVPRPLQTNQWVAANGDVYFAGYAVDTGMEPWIWRAANGEAVMLQEHFPGVAGSFPHEFVHSGDKVYYVAESRSGKAVLFSVRTDTGEVASESGTSANITAPHRISAIPGGVICTSRETAPPYFALYPIGSGIQEGVSIVPTLVHFDARHAPKDICHTGDALYYDLHDPLYGRELWVKPDNDHRPRLVRDIFPAHRAGAMPPP